MLQTKVKVASIASIIFIIPAIIIHGFVTISAETSTFIGFCAVVALMITLASYGIIIFLHKLDLERSRFHDILQWTAFVFWGVGLFLFFMNALCYERSFWFVRVLYLLGTGILIIAWLISVIMTFRQMLAVAPSLLSSSGEAHLDNRSSIQEQEHLHRYPHIFYTPTERSVWTIFYIAIIMTVCYSIILVDLFISPRDSGDISMAGTFIAIFVYAILTVSTWIVATTPSSPPHHDTEEPLAVPQDDNTSATRNDGNIMVSS
jgi:hypothetical protein